MRKKELPDDYTLVLHQIEEDGGDAFEDLAQTLQFDRGRLGHILRSLQHKGLIIISRSRETRESWLSLTSKGRKFMTYLWPESHYAPGF